MKHRTPITKCGSRRERGVVLITVALAIIALLGFAAICVDSGYLLYSQRRLQASTDAAALAGAVDLWTRPWSTAYGDALAYTTNQNGVPSNVTITNTSITGLTLASGVLPFNQAASGYNGIQVVQRANVPVYFGRIFGIQTIPISAKSKAAAGGAGNPAQYNVVIVLDTTRSMSTTIDSNCGNLTRLQCAKNGALTLLTGLTNAGDNVVLMAFPPQTSSTYNFTCSGQAAHIASSYSQSGASYAYTSANQSSGTSGYLGSNGQPNARSSLVQALGGGKCAGLPGPGGLGTFYAQAIASANNTLTQMSSTQNPPGHNVIVLLSDGTATADTSELGNTYKQLYGSECQAAINTASTAKSSGTTIYTIAYLGGEGVSAPKCADGNDPLTACNTMRAIATSPSDFFSDTCANAAGGPGKLNALFAQIAYSLTKPRLIPANAT